MKLVMLVLLYPSLISLPSIKKEEEDILEDFSKVGVDIPLLNVIKQILRYVRFLKELCTTKRRLRGSGRITLSENVSTLI